MSISQDERDILGDHWLDNIVLQGSAMLLTIAKRQVEENINKKTQYLSAMKLENRSG